MCYTYRPKMYFGPPTYAGSRRKYVRTFVQTTIFLANNSTLKQA